MQILKFKKKNKAIYIRGIFLLLITLMMSGCVSQAFSVGDEKSYCEEHGCDYRDVGLCANPLDILENKDNLDELKKQEEAKNANL